MFPDLSFYFIFSFSSLCRPIKPEDFCVVFLFFHSGMSFTPGRNLLLSVISIFFFHL